jgi:hypothetical protein
MTSEPDEEPDPEIAPPHDELHWCRFKLRRVAFVCFTDPKPPNQVHLKKCLSREPACSLVHQCIFVGGSKAPFC